MIKFYNNRYKFFLLSAALILIGLIVAIVVGVKVDIQFTGGSILRYQTAVSVDLDQAANVAGEITGRTVSAQESKNIANNEIQLVLNVAGNRGLDAETQDKITAALNTTFPEAKLAVAETTNVEPFFGQAAASRAIWALALASILITLYVWIRFRSISGLSAGIMALVALLHDMLMVLAAFIVFKIPLNDSLIAVELTILGYSINDTIVIYDRIRENKRSMKKHDELSELVDKSINQSLTRSINTSLCTFGAILVAYLFALFYGIRSIQEFALPMLIGIISGCYSTIFIAGPLWVMWKTRNVKKHA